MEFATKEYRKMRRKINGNRQSVVMFDHALDQELQRGHDEGVAFEIHLNNRRNCRPCVEGCRYCRNDSH